VAGGYYFLHHAAGLLLGKSAAYNPDPYSINRQKEDSFLSLCRSGNPQYAMYGIVASLYDVKDISTIRLDAGISNKECFVTSADIQKTIYPYSIHGLLSHYQKDGQNIEPVQVITHFARAIVKPGNFFTLQGCYYATSVYHENARLLFDTSLQNNAAIESFGGYSLYMQYQDKKIKLFMEYAISQVVMNNEGDSENKYTNAYYWGMSVTGKIFSASGIMQKSDKYFYAPFSNTFGSNSPRDIYYYSVKLKPAKKVTFRWAYIDQNNLLPSQYYAEYPHKRIHSVTIAYKNNSFVIKTDYRNALFYKDGMEDRVSRLQQKVVWGITQNASLHLKCGLYQGNATAWYLASGMGFKFGRLQNDCGAIYAHTKDEKIYIALLPLPHTSIMSEAIATSSFFIVERLRYSNSSCKLSARLVWQMHPQKQTLGELSASVWF
ncbi:MAG: hypothetical protein N3F66_06660, partial [Spirochaetes bacterium]|nr:hypothetical protein [Spirochaetota bacterium]